MEVAILFAMILCFIAIIYYGDNNKSTQSKILVILQSLQSVSNPNVSKETIANLVDIGIKFTKENAIDNVSRTDSLWEEDRLEGEEIEEVYGR